MSLSKPTALIVTPFSADRHGIAVQQRVARWVDVLSRDHDVWQLVVRRYDNVDPSDAERGPGPGERWLEVPTESHLLAYRWRQFLRYVARLHPSPRTWSLGWRREWAYVTDDTRRILRDRLRGRRFVRVICVRVHVWDVVQATGEVATFDPACIELDYDDWESESRRSVGRRMWQSGRRWEGGMTWIDGKLAQRMERQLLSRFRRVWLAAATDAEAFRRTGICDRAEVFANFPDLSVPEPVGAGPGCTVGFIGSLSYYPNIDAIEFLIDEIWPRLNAEPDNWRLIIAGREASPELQKKLATAEGVEFLGDIERVDTFYARVKVVASPVRCGSGTKLKVLEAMAWGKPVVATAHSVRGLGLKPGVHFSPADTAEAFVDEFKKLKADPLRAKALGAKAREWIHQQPALAT